MKLVLSSALIITFVISLVLYADAQVSRTSSTLYPNLHFDSCRRFAGESGLNSAISSCYVGNETVGVLISAEPGVLTSNISGDRILHFKFFDKNTNAPINKVTFFLNVTKGDQRFFNELFYSITGTIAINFQSGGNIGKLEVLADVEPILGGWMSQTDNVTLKGPIFREPGIYHMNTNIIGVGYPLEIINPLKKISFDSYVKVRENNFEIISTNPLKQFKSGMPAQDINCRDGLFLMIKKSDDSPACLTLNTANDLVNRGWGIVYHYSPLILTGSDLQIITDKTHYTKGERVHIILIKNGTRQIFVSDRTTYGVEIHNSDGKSVYPGIVEDDVYPIQNKWRFSQTWFQTDGYSGRQVDPGKYNVTVDYWTNNPIDNYKESSIIYINK